MRCNDFDTFIDEMLSGVLHPDASQHMSRCERCTSHFRARASVQNGLRQLASATLAGPSSATDRAVMDSYRRLQQRRSAAGISGSAAGAGAAPAAAMARLFTFPSRTLAESPRTWWSAAAAAAMVVAVLGSAVHLWNGVPTVHSPSAAYAPPAAAWQQRSTDAPQQSAAAGSVERGLPARTATPQLNAWLNVPQKTSQSASLNVPQSASHSLNVPQSASHSGFSLLEVATAGFRPEPFTNSVRTNHAAAARPAAAYEEAKYDSTPVTQLPAGVAPVARLAASGASGSVGQPASSTWPGYSNLMYCDPVVCSGPMQVVHIKVPVGQVKPNLGQSVDNGFVNAEVVIGPDGVARAIRVAN
jgi:hypothetical protein